MRRANIFVYDECISQDISFPDLPVFLSEHYGQCAEDLIVASLLLAWSKRAGIELSSLRYLEIGGNHPIATSATFLLNQRFAMRGVIVEANPALIECLQRVRHNDVILHGAVQNEPVSTVSFSVSNQNELSSLDRSFVLGWRAGEVGERALITVPALRINEIVEAHFPGRPPAYLSIDVEGMDLRLLEDFDWARFRPVIVQAEPSDEHIPGNSERIQEFMVTQGYVLIARTEVNVIFMATESIGIFRQNASVGEDGVPQRMQKDSLLGVAQAHLDQARAEIGHLREQLAASDAGVQANESIIRQLYQSRSWKVTAPLRTLTRILGFVSKLRVQDAVPTPSAAPTGLEVTSKDPSHNVADTVRSFNIPNPAVSICKDLYSLDEFKIFVKANPIFFDDAVENNIVRHCQIYGTQSVAMGICGPSDVAIIGPESREHLMVRGLNSRQRAVLEELYSFLENRNLRAEEVKIYGHEAITPLALFLRGHFPKYIGTEFTQDEAQRADLFPILHGDICRSDFESSSFDLIISCDVLEHVPSIDEALTESARLLVKGGRFVGSVPFLYNRQDSVKFATLKNGAIEHLVQPPIYHGNPMDEGGGSLVFEIPGWDILDRAKKAGFAHATLRFLCDQNKGIVAASASEQLRAKGVFVAIFDK